MVPLVMRFGSFNHSSRRVAQRAVGTIAGSPGAPVAYDALFIFHSNSWRDCSNRQRIADGFRKIGTIPGVSSSWNQPANISLSPAAIYGMVRVRGAHEHNLRDIDVDRRLHERYDHSSAVRRP
jgi:hypothetical protein